MTYTKRTDIPVQSGEIAVELDTGALVAVRCDRKRVDQGLSYHSSARQIDAQGRTLTYPNGSPIRTEFKHACSVERVDELTDSAIVREMLLAVLGEPVSLIPWPESVLTSVSIRVSIAAAAVAGPADAGAVL